MDAINEASDGCGGDAEATNRPAIGCLDFLRVQYVPALEVGRVWDPDYLSMRPEVEA